MKLKLNIIFLIFEFQGLSKGNHVKIYKKKLAQQPVKQLVNKINKLQ